jgi:predicted transcriptional regulator
MNPLADLLSSKVKAELFRLLFGVPAARLHLRELARQSGLAVGTVRQELDRLARLGVVLSDADGNRIYYRANQQHPLYPNVAKLRSSKFSGAGTFRSILH